MCAGLPKLIMFALIGLATFRGAIAEKARKPNYSRDDSRGERVVKAYNYGQDLLDDDSTRMTTDKLIDNLKKKGSDYSYLCKDYSICVNSANSGLVSSINQGPSDADKAKYWKQVALAAIGEMLKKQDEADKCVLNAEMFAELMSDGGRGVMAHLRASGSMAKRFFGYDTYMDALDKANGGGSRTVRKYREERSERKSSRKSRHDDKLDCSGEDKGSIRCESELESFDAIYDHVKILSYRGQQALVKAEKEAATN